jgi:hypothetical protein
MRLVSQRRTSPRLPVTFQAALARFKAECRQAAPNGDVVFDAADQGHPKRWADDPRAEAVWQKIQSLAWGPVGTFDPLDSFIFLVLGVRRGAETAQTNTQLTQKHRQRRAQQLQCAVQLEALSRVWKDMARGNDPRSNSPSNALICNKEEAHAWRKLSKKPPSQRDSPCVSYRVRSRALDHAA